MIPQFEPYIKPEYAEAVAKQVASGWVGTGKAVVEFEERIGDITGAKYNIATTNGTSALILALLALDLRPNSRVAFPAYTFIAGASATSFLGHTVHLVDVSKDTMCMCPTALEREMQEWDFDAVIFVNHNGYVGLDVGRVATLCEVRNIPMIEDACQAILSDNAGRRGKCGTFSFSVPKPITTGQGGLLFTDDEEVAQRVYQMRNHGERWQKNKVHHHLGINLKFNDVSAALGLAQLNNLDEIRTLKAAIAKQYRKHIHVHPYNHSYLATMVLQFALVIPSDVIIKSLADNDIQAVKHYRPLNHHTLYQTERVFEGAEWVYKHSVYLPSSLQLGNDLTQIDKICGIILES